MKKIILKILDIADKTYYNWKNENRPIINLLEKYHTKDELQEFLETGKIEKQERLKELLEIEKKYNQITKITNGE
ncbi:hypothetical protein [Aliarcobacter butzleri]|uniref:hypothetical protein n=1 Tax=Aliarcobacter butzleri TaxID=28197 RepID=UPI002B248DE9|nr:hypothetical protein [Aliarcobacter butzleri]